MLPIDRRVAVGILVLFTVAAFFAFQPWALVDNLPSRPRISLSWHTAPVPSNSNAFVFYATNPGYACGALLLIDQLSTLSPNVPSVLMVPPTMPNATLVPFEKYNTTILRLNPPPLAPGGNEYYSAVLLKLMAFSLKRHLPHLDRIIVMDSDQTVLQPLHPLFALPSADIAAPEAYWLDPAAYITSTMLVISLSDRLWREVSAGLKSIKRKEYDMDLVNRLFYPRRMVVLPGSHCTLNSHWENLDLPVWMQNKEEGLDGLWKNEAVVVHFTAGGKPWAVNMNTIRDKKADPLFALMFESWRRDAEAMCAPGWDSNPWPT